MNAAFQYWFDYIVRNGEFSVFCSNDKRIKEISWGLYNGRIIPVEFCYVAVMRIEDDNKTYKRIEVERVIDNNKPIESFDNRIGEYAAFNEESFSPSDEILKNLVSLRIIG